MKFDLSQYATVEERLAKFWKDHPEGAVITEMVNYDDKTVVFRACVYFERGGDIVATGYAEEVRDASPVNRTSFVENGETSAIGRALANCNYQMKKRASREEMESVQRKTANQSQALTQEPSGVMSEAQRSTLNNLANELKIGPQLSVYLSKHAGREIMRVDDLTKQEATRIISAMIRERSQMGEGQ